MDTFYILWSTRNGGWMTRGGTYSSERNRAQQFSRSEAFALCKTHAGFHGHELGLIPINLDDIAEILA